jgi:hypothetical protein
MQEAKAYERSRPGKVGPARCARRPSSAVLGTESGLARAVSRGQGYLLSREGLPPGLFELPKAFLLFCFPPTPATA